MDSGDKAAMIVMVFATICLTIVVIVLVVSERFGGC